MRRLKEASLVVVIVAVLAAIFGGHRSVYKQTEPAMTTTVVKSPTFEDTVQEVIDSVVHIRNVTQGWQGSGILVVPDIVLTARHVAEGGDDFDVTLNDGTVVKSYRALSSKKYDIGFLQLEKPVDSIARLGSISDCRLGQSVFAIGSPFGEVNRNSVTLGIISRLECDLEKFDCPLEMGWSAVFQTDCPAYPGNSGCPLFTLDGVVRGIIVGGFDDNLIYCIPVDSIMGQIDVIQLMFQIDSFELEEGFIPYVIVHEDY